MQFNHITGISGLSSSPASLPSIGGLSPIGLSPASVGEAQEGTGVRSFADTLAGAIGNVNEAMDNSKKMTEGLMAGTVDNLHDVTIAGAKAEVMMKLTTTITSKLAQATTQLFQMQV